MRTFLIPGFDGYGTYNSFGETNFCDSEKIVKEFSFSAEDVLFGTSTTSAITMKAKTIVGGLPCPTGPGCPGPTPGGKTEYSETTYINFTHTASTQVVKVSGIGKTYIHAVIGPEFTKYPTNGCPPYAENCPGPTYICGTKTTFIKVSGFGTAYTSTALGLAKETTILTNWGFSENKTTKHFPVGMPIEKIPFRAGARMLLEHAQETLITTTVSSVKIDTTGKKCTVITGSFDIPLTSKSTWKHPVFVFKANSFSLTAGEPMPWMAQDGSQAETPCATQLVGSQIRRVPVGWFGTNLDNLKWTTSNSLPNGWTTKPFTFQNSGSCYSSNPNRTVQIAFAHEPVRIAQLPGETFLTSFEFAKLLPNCTTAKSNQTLKSCKPRQQLIGEIHATRYSLEKMWIDNKGTSVRCTPEYFKVTTARVDAFGNASVYKHFRGKLMALGTSTGLSYWKNNPKGELSPYARIGGREVYGSLVYEGVKPKIITDVEAGTHIHGVRAGHAASMLPDADGWSANLEGEYGTAILGPLATNQSVFVTFQKFGGSAYGWLVATDKAGATGSTAKLNDRFAFQQIEKPFGLKPSKTTLQYTSPFSAIMDQVAWDIPNRTALGVQGRWWSRPAAAVYDAPLIVRTPVGSDTHTHFSKMMSTISPDATSAHPVKGSVGTTPWRTLHAYNPQFQD